MERREFIGMAAVGLGALSLGMKGCGSPKAVAPSDWVNLGIIGVGGRGQHLMRMMLRVPGVRIAGLCDIYEPRITEGRKVTGEQTPAFSDHRKLLDAREIDAVLIASPLSLHAEHAIDALSSGRAVYCEKSMGRTLDDCNRIRDAVRRTGKILQVGLQYTYAPWYMEARRRIQAGGIGQVTQVYSYWHRNNNWRRPLPPGASAEIERLLNWRLYREWSGGLLAELGSHQISFANTLFGDLPDSAMASGGIDYWKDGREIEDNVHAILRYPGGQTLQASFITTNRLDGAQERIFGTGGSIVLTHTEATYYQEPWYPNSAVPPEMTIEHKLITGPTYSAEQPYTGKGEIPLKGDVSDADLLACREFIDCIRTHRSPVADVNLGWSEAVTVALCNRALETGRKIKLTDFLAGTA